MRKSLIEKYKQVEVNSNKISNILKEQKELITSMVRLFFGNKQGVFISLENVLDENGEEVDRCDIFNHCVTYDGGNHPEYASNAYFEVNGFGIDKKGVIYLSIDDTDYYELDRCDTRDVVCLSDIIYELDGLQYEIVDTKW